MEKQPKTITLPTFNTAEDVMADAYLLKCIQDTINEMLAERDKVSEGGKIKLQRNAVSLLIDLNKFNAEFIASEYIRIRNKGSFYPTVVREFISFMVVECVDKTFKHYENLFQKQNKKTSKTKKS